jgi:hypothetical protein
MTTRAAIAAAWTFAAACVPLLAPELASALGDRPWIPGPVADGARGLAALAAPIVAFRAGVRRTAWPIRDRTPILREPDPPPTAPLTPGAPVAADPIPVPGPPTVHRVLLLGASSVQGWFGVELEDRLRAEGVRVRREGKVGTGLVRPDWFDWVPETGRLVADFHPDLVIAQFGGNDCVTADWHGRPAYFGTATWEPAFRLRFDAFLAAVGDAPLLLVGMQHPQDKDLARRLSKYNAAMERAAADAHAPYLSTWTFTEGPDHQPLQTVTFGGRTGLQYDPDGIHLSKLGGDHMAAWLVGELKARYNLAPLASAPGSGEAR